MIVPFQNHCGSLREQNEWKYVVGPAGVQVGCERWARCPLKRCVGCGAQQDPGQLPPGAHVSPQQGGTGDRWRNTAEAVRLQDHTGTASRRKNKKNKNQNLLLYRRDKLLPSVWHVQQFTWNCNTVVLCSHKLWAAWEIKNKTLQHMCSSHTWLGS